MRYALALLLALAASGTARADMFGGDDLILGEILSNAIQQLTELMQIVQTSQNSLQFMQDLNRGINDSLQVAQTMRQAATGGLYSNLTDKLVAAQQLTSLYGKVTSSPEASLQTNNDLAAAEAIAQNNAAFAQATKIDQIGEAIKGASHAVSPGGASKLTAEGVGVMLHVMNESLRTEATGVKLAAQRAAAENHRDKETTKATLKAASDLGQAMDSIPTTFTTPRF